MTNKILKINNLKTEIEDIKILQGVTLELPAGQVHALMGPNGSGKSTLALSLAGHPHYQITQGTITLNGQDITQSSAESRSLAGLFLAFQYPSSITGVPLGQMLRVALNRHREAKKETSLTPRKFKEYITPYLTTLSLKPNFLDRYLNEGFSGGEKKKAEILQLLVLEPKYAILDETDSGLDIDALKVVAQGVNQLKKLKEKPGILVITHYQRILKYIKTDQVHIMVNGKIAKSGPPNLVDILEKEGYKKFQT